MPTSTGQICPGISDTVFGLACVFVLFLNIHAQSMRLRSLRKHREDLEAKHLRSHKLVSITAIVIMIAVVATLLAQSLTTDDGT